MLSTKMVTASKFFTLTLFFIISCKSQKGTAFENYNRIDGEIPQFSLKFEEKLKDIYLESAIQGDFLLAVVDKKGLMYSTALNQELLNGKKSSLNNNSPIYIASATKAFTGTLLKMLEEQGVMDLNKSLKEYLPQITLQDSIDVKTISLKSLLNHTHGIMSNTLVWKTAYLGYSGTNEELIADLNNDVILDASGAFRYSNVGPIIAGIAVENHTGNSWKHEMGNRIFKPLKMKSTSTRVSHFQLKNIRPSITVSKENKIIESGFYKNDITMHASGGIISTLNDLSKWLSANIRQDKVLLNEKSWTALHSPTTKQNKEYFTYHRSGYSLGWDIAEYQNQKILTRFGSWLGISFHMSFLPDKKVGIIALSTDNRAYLLPHLMANYAYNTLNGLAAETIFKVEKEKFDEAFSSENEIQYHGTTQMMRVNAKNDSLLGYYHNSKNWPDISINRKNNSYVLRWGNVEGKIFVGENGSYLADLGALKRKFEIKNNILYTGSLVYYKQE